MERQVYYRVTCVPCERFFQEDSHELVSWVNLFGSLEIAIPNTRGEPPLIDAFGADRRRYADFREGDRLHGQSVTQTGQAGRGQKVEYRHQRACW